MSHPLHPSYYFVPPTAAAFSHEEQDLPPAAFPVSPIDKLQGMTGNRDRLELCQQLPLFSISLVLD